MNILIFQVSSHTFHDFSIPMIFQTWKISTLNSMTFQTFPRSVRTLDIFHTIGISSLDSYNDDVTFL